MRLRRADANQLAGLLRTPALAALLGSLVAAAPQALAYPAASRAAGHTALVALGPSAQAQPASVSRLAVAVLDENKVAVQFAQVTLSDAGGAQHCETDYAGHCSLGGLRPGPYQLRVEKEGFFAALDRDVEVGTTETVDVTLNHQRELVERVNVVYSPPAIDPQKTVSSSTLSSREIIDLPYTVPRDLRYVLPMLPGVLPDATAQVHVDGSDSPQTIYLLDEFTLNAPESRNFLTRLSVDAVRSVTLQNSRYPAEYGGGTGGVLAVATGMGDDHFRITGTDFLPSLTENKGLHIGSWYPRVTLTGPLKQGRAWFLIAPQGEYDQTFYNDLPAGQNSIPAWSYSQLAKAQVNLTRSNILTGTLLFNGFGEDNSGLSIFDPLPTTVDLRQSNRLIAVKDQLFLPGGALFEAGFAETAFYSNLLPQGDMTYVLGPTSASGNYFESSRALSGRLEGLADLVLPPRDAAGRHELRFGINMDRITYQNTYTRNPFQIVRADGTLDRSVSFMGPPVVTRDNFAFGAYAQDRWSVHDRLTISPGVRLDWDELVREPLVSPRLAASYLLDHGGETKLVGGIGLYYDSTDLNQLSLPLQGARTDVFYDITGKVALGPPVITSFGLAPEALKEPRVLNWSGGVERKLPGAIYADFEYVEKRGRDGFAYFNSCRAIANCLSGDFRLLNDESTRYRAGRVNLRRQFKGNHVVFVSYTESRARSSAGLAFSLENPLFSPQVSGPLPWDSPHRLISWGFLPLLRGYDLAYTVDARSGFPFYTLNQNQQLVAPPGAYRLPAYFSLDLAAEKRFYVFGFEWALRAGFNNITNRHNPAYVDNNVNSPQFLTYGGVEGRALTGQIRLLGRKK
ncbi:MAG TPA: TonB-dependent receptor [Terriglobia bacterium]|nr:TonB-dependent receptor [Terriglobia bacterium]